MASDRIQRNVERLLDAIDEAIATRAWDSVRDHAQDVLALDPTNREALSFLDAADRALGGTRPPPLESPAPSSASSISAELSDQPNSFANGR